VEQFPANSHNSKINEPPQESPSDRPRNLRVVTEAATRRKKPFGARLISIFKNGEDFKTATTRVIFDRLIPAILEQLAESGKEIMEQLVDGGKEIIDRVVWGENRAPSRSSRSSKSHISYHRMGSSSSNRFEKRDLSRRDRALHNLDEVDFRDKGTAEEAIDFLYATLQEYQQVTVADFYSIAGLSSEPQDENWGWKDIRGVRVARNRDDTYSVIGLPRPIPLYRR
jgi:hypothetical protein